AQGIPDDIADRPALIIDSKNSRMDMIPAGLPGESRTGRVVNIFFRTRGGAVLEGAVHYTGRAAAAMAGLSLELSRASIDHNITKALAEDTHVKSAEIEDYDLSSRITRD